MVTHESVFPRFATLHSEKQIRCCVYFRFRGFFDYTYLDISIPYYTLADWRNKSKHKPKEAELSDTELKIRNRELERENAELRQANEILKDALGFFAKDRKK